MTTGIKAGLVTGPVSGVHKIILTSRSDRGRLRSSNQDSVLASSFHNATGEIVLIAVADGVGGASGGASASRTVIESMAGSRDLAIGADAGGAPALAEWLDQAVGLTRRRLAESSGEPGSTTLTAVSIHGTTAAWVHLGDSRAYLIRRGQLTQLTHDHCVAEELVQRGLLAKEDAHFFRGGDALTRFLSPGTGHQPHVGQFELEPGDLVLVCSDGLYRMVSEADILTTSARATSRTAASIELMADQLVAAANDNGGTDNISFALAALPA